MGLEAQCSARFDGKKSAGKARLEQKDLQFRGDFRLDIPLDSITRADASRGVLSVTFRGGAAEFELGKQAEKWALKIRYPKPLIEKLGVKPGSHVLIVGKHEGVGDESFWRDLRARAREAQESSSLPSGGELKAAEIIFFFAEAVGELKPLAKLQRAMQRNAAIWVVYPKGVKIIREADVMAAAKAAGLVDIKNASFSETHSALKLVIPVAAR
jgi:hypothetical protein